jgi:geranylgeranyl pyrophosphate synthase
VTGRRSETPPDAGEFERFASSHRLALEAALSGNLPDPVRGAERLADAARSAVLSPGKRVRPLVALAAGEIVRAKPAASLAVPVAVEYVHAASLVLDDLPSMDNASRRRGKPALHLEYGVATAELAAVTLLSRAFEVVARSEAIPSAVRARIVGELAAAVGAAGCCGGQAADLAAEPTTLALDDLESIHARKTGALFVAAVRGGALAGGASDGALEAFTAYARNLGLAFQITDDLLDLEGDPARLGKDTRRDGHRANFAAVLGPGSSRELVRELLEAAVTALVPFRGRAAVLSDLARFVRDRRT